MRTKEEAEKELERDLKENDPCKDCPTGIKGSCCYFSIMIDGFNVILFRHPCKYLDTKTMTCDIYKRRFELNVKFELLKEIRNRGVICGYCSNTKEGLAQGLFPKECYYYKNYTELRGECPPRVKFREIENKISDNGRLNYSLYNRSPQQFVIHYNHYIRAMYCIPMYENGSHYQYWTDNIKNAGLDVLKKEKNWRKTIPV